MINRLVHLFSQAYALDMLRIGCNGESIADTTAPEINKKGEDVNIGWHALEKDYQDAQQSLSTPLTCKSDPHPTPEIRSMG
ncbi:P2 family phage major capsid protein [Klebsiella aerogenes]|uniref:P2 family phage major capsid protein n=1 Tax=Klebsiella aerogenes TaxID=548 RepID=UPI001CEF92D9|nr:P2 family phage major capsid protein [Klebsiella aerogenes]